MSHTPGPWIQSFLVPTAVDDATHWIIDCRVINDDKKTAISNARLIAAAPDLLDACKAYEENGCCATVSKMISAAIAKATVETIA